MSTSCATPEDVERAGVLAMEALQGRRVLFWRTAPKADALRRYLEDAIRSANHVDMNAAGFADFERADDLMSKLISAVREYLATAGLGRDERHAFDDLVRQLENVRLWFGRGMSPDPSKRPSESELDRMAEDRAAVALRELASAK